MKELSIIIPSLRRNELECCLESIRLNTTDVDYEVIVVSPFGPWEKHRNVVWVEEKERSGVVSAVISGEKKASGMYITTLSDEARVLRGWAKNMITFLRQQPDVRVIGNFRVVDFGEQMQFFYYGRLFSIFPFARKSFIDSLGGLFSSEYKAFYADPDLGVRCWESGGQVITCPNAFIQHPYILDNINRENRLLYEEDDKKTFIRRWGHLQKSDNFYAEKLFIQE